MAATGAIGRRTIGRPHPFATRFIRVRELGPGITGRPIRRGTVHRTGRPTIQPVSRDAGYVPTEQAAHYEPGRPANRPPTTKPAPQKAAAAETSGAEAAADQAGSAEQAAATEPAGSRTGRRQQTAAAAADRRQNRRPAPGRPNPAFGSPEAVMEVARRQKGRLLAVLLAA